MKYKFLTTPFIILKGDQWQRQQGGWHPFPTWCIGKPRDEDDIRCCNYRRPVKAKDGKAKK